MLPETHATESDKVFFDNVSFVLEFMVKDNSNLTYDELEGILNRRKVASGEIGKYIGFLKSEQLVNEIKTVNHRVFLGDDSFIKRFLNLNPEIENFKVWTKFGLENGAVSIVRETWVDTVHKRKDDFIFDGTYIKNGEFFHFHGFNEGDGPRIIITKDIVDNYSSEDIEWIEAELLKNVNVLFAKNESKK